MEARVLDPPRRWAVALDDNVTPESEIPRWPGVDLARAAGVEETWELVRSSLPDRAWEKAPRPAKAGEMLRDETLCYVPDWTANLQWRSEIEVRCAEDPDFRVLQLELCRSSVLYFCNTFVWTYDPRRLPLGIVPFVTFPVQEEHIAWVVWKIRHKESGQAEKSRDMGASWIYVVIGCWLALFHPRVMFDFMSQIEDDVDNRTPDSLIGKCRLLLNNLPDWMRGGWVEGDRGMDNHMKLTIPETGSIINGVLSRGTAKRGGRSLALVGDEYAFVENSEAVLRAINDVTNCVFLVSTANGMGNAFYRMATDPRTDLRRLHYSEHPLKTEEWKLLRLTDPRMTPQSWASEHEIDYTGSMPGRVYPNFRSSAVEPGEWVHVRDDELVEFDPHFDVDTGQDYGMHDAAAFVFVQIKPAPPEVAQITPYTYCVIDEFEAKGETVDAYRYYLNSLPYRPRYRYHVGDLRTGSARDSLGGTWVKNFRREVAPGHRVRTKRWGMVEPGPPIVVHGRFNSEDAPIQVVQRLLRTHGAFAINARCRRSIACFQNWSYPTQENPVTGEVEAIPGSSPTRNPANHQWSNLMKAIAYHADFVLGAVKRGQKVEGLEWDFPALRLRVRS